MKPTLLLEFARDLARRDTPDTAGLWPRAAALLARQALEAAVDDLWRSREPAMCTTSARARFLCLRATGADPLLVADAAYAWAALSSACHRHAFDLPPTAEELEALFARVEAVIVETTGHR